MIIKYKYNIILLLFVLFFGRSISVAQDSKVPNNRITTVIDSSDILYLTMKQEFTANVPLESVWEAYTTKTGWENWAVPLAEVDFKLNGTIRTNYNKEGQIGDSTTITINVLNFIPNKLITLQAEMSKHFPDFMQREEKDFYNIIIFENVDENKTKVISYGLGYKNNEKYKSLMKFFISANEETTMNLIKYLENGETIK